MTHSQWGDWLGRQLCSLHLRQLVEELQVVAECSDSQAPQLMLKDVLDDRQLFELLQSGPASLEVDEIQQLLANPDNLGELQEFVLTTGSNYWDQLSQESDAAERARAIFSSVSAIDSGQNVKPQLISIVEQRGGARFLAVATSLAAVLLLAATFWPRGLEPSGRMLGTPGLMMADVDTPQVYLERLAVAGNTWFDQTPRDAAELGVLLREVSSDCEILINAKHSVLASQKLADGTTPQDWFVAKCSKWKSDFDQTLANLESGTMDFETARSQANTTMMKLVTVLRSGPPA